MVIYFVFTARARINKDFQNNEHETTQLTNFAAFSTPGLFHLLIGIINFL